MHLLFSLKGVVSRLHSDGRGGAATGGAHQQAGEGQQRGMQGAYVIHQVYIERKYDKLKKGLRRFSCVTNGNRYLGRSHR